MGLLARLIDRIDAKLDRRADQSVLTGERNPGSEAITGASDSEGALSAAATGRHSRDRRRWRWLNLGG